MPELSKNQETLLRSLYTRHGRKKHNLCVCEGLRCCREFYASRPDLIEFAVSSSDFDPSRLPGPDFMVVPADSFRKISSTIETQGVLIVTRKPDFLSPEEAPSAPFILVLDRISDPGNFGTILRTAQAAGLNEIWFTEGSVDPFNNKVIRAAMAVQFTLRLREFSSLEKVSEALSRFHYGTVYRTDPHFGKNIFREKNIFDRSAVILGSEGDGAGELPDSIPLTIPMPGNAESINVAQAATVILFEYVRTLNLP